MLLAGWYELHQDLAQTVYAFLTGRGWQILPVESDRSRLPGFLTRWPKADTFEELDEAFAQAYPEDKTHEYDLNLMIAWMWGRLPVELVESAEIDSEEAQEDQAPTE